MYLIELLLICYELGNAIPTGGLWWGVMVAGAAGEF